MFSMRILNRKKSLAHVIERCRTSNFTLVADEQFFIQELNIEYLPLLEGIKVMITEEMIENLNNQLSGDIVLQNILAERTLELIEKMADICEISLIPKTTDKDTFNLYCYRQQLNYKIDSDRILAYYLKWNEVRQYSLLFVTSDKRNYKKAKKQGLSSILLKGET